MFDTRHSRYIFDTFNVRMILVFLHIFPCVIFLKLVAVIVICFLQCFNLIDVLKMILNYANNVWVGMKRFIY